MARPPDMRTMPVPRGQARGIGRGPRPAAGGATSNRGGTLAQVQQVMENAPPKVRQAIGEVLDKDGVAAAISFIQRMTAAQNKNVKRPAVPQAVAAKQPPAQAMRRPPARGPARMMKGGMYKGKPHSYAAGGKVKDGKY